MPTDRGVSNHWQSLFVLRLTPWTSSYASQRVLQDSASQRPQLTGSISKHGQSIQLCATFSPVFLERLLGLCSGEHEPPRGEPELVMPPDEFQASHATIPHCQTRVLAQESRSTLVWVPRYDVNVTWALVSFSLCAGLPNEGPDSPSCMGVPVRLKCVMAASRNVRHSSLSRNCRYIMNPLMLESQQLQEATGRV